jgi:16S rRNA A1518/A1519 N6-dimethyltransferase RsmA/KsgA/DIM1 with predicted DNA glycosylase/AP lyase activity
MHFTLIVTREELLIISEGLSNLPYKVSAQLITNLQQQIDKQQQRSDGSPSEN